MAHKKAGSSSKNGRDSVGQRLGVKAGDGQTVTADDDYLALAITDPDAQVAADYSTGVMSAATDPQGFDARPDDVEALVAYIKAQR